MMPRPFTHYVYDDDIAYRDCTCADPVANHRGHLVTHRMPPSPERPHVCEAHAYGYADVPSPIDPQAQVAQVKYPVHCAICEKELTKETMDTYWDRLKEGVP